MIKIKRREILTQNSLKSMHPVLARIYASRGILEIADVTYTLNTLVPYHSLLNIHKAAQIIGDAVLSKKRILIIGDFDADGATATAVGIRALHLLGLSSECVDFLVPNRFEYGYGLTPGIVDVASERKPDIIITVDNGISSIEGVERAREKGIDVVITDHHLAGATLPNAAVIVNPNQPNDEFPSKALAGVGVIFYVMLATRAYLQEKNYFTTPPNMASLLDIVALGTVADVVPLDKNNRILVHFGLERIRAGKACAGISALLAIAKRDYSKVSASDLGFSAGPRLNAAGRLDDMSLGIRCLLTDDITEATQTAEKLSQLNTERQGIEQEMQRTAMDLMQNIAIDSRYLPDGICLYEPSWHQGVIGILAGRIKEKFHRPVVAFADSTEEGVLKGSARSIPGVHIRDVLDTVAKRHPELLEKFGGHAMAAGLSIQKSAFSAFQKAFREAIKHHADDEAFHAEIFTDGALQSADITMELAATLKAGGPWGQHFPEPLFDGFFQIYDQRLLQGKHLKLCLGIENTPVTVDAIAFNVDEKDRPNARCKGIYAVYKLDINEYQGRRTLQLLIEHLQPQN